VPIALTPAAIESIGILAATLTTLCWLPQALHVIRTRDTAAISLPAYAAFSTGIALWLIYGVLIGNWPLIGANTISLVLTLIILVTKIRYG
jgi:MtN3 and saliva related transmembrane protein